MDCEQKGEETREDYQVTEMEEGGLESTCSILFTTDARFQEHREAAYMCDRSGGGTN